MAVCAQEVEDMVSQFLAGRDEGMLGFYVAVLGWRPEFDDVPSAG